jgi:hypothetical protein
MKKLISVFVLLSLAGCNDRTKEFGQGLIEWPGEVVKTVFNIDDYDKDEQVDQNGRINELEKKMLALEEQDQLQDNLLSELSYTQETYYHELYDLIDATNLGFSNNIEVIEGQIAALEALSGHQVVELIDPCGDQSGYDEVLIRLNSGDLIGYFEQGNKRFLTVLEPGRYKTTDNGGCYFTVTQDMEVVYE